MLKLKLAVASLALTGLILVIMGSTYFTAAAAIACTAMAAAADRLSRMEMAPSGRQFPDSLHSMGASI